MDWTISLFFYFFRNICLPGSAGEAFPPYAIPAPLVNEFRSAFALDLAGFRVYLIEKIIVRVSRKPDLLFEVSQRHRIWKGNTIAFAYLGKQIAAKRIELSTIHGVCLCGLQFMIVAFSHGFGQRAGIVPVAFHRQAELPAH